MASSTHHSESRVYNPITSFLILGALDLVGGAVLLGIEEWQKKRGRDVNLVENVPLRRLISLGIELPAIALLTKAVF